MTVTCEGQYDAKRRTVTMVATTGFGPGHRYAITVEAHTKQEADDKLAEFRKMYAALGAVVA
jgi:hypothetical protein